MAARELAKNVRGHGGFPGDFERNEKSSAQKMSLFTFGLMGSSSVNSTK